MRIRTTLFFLLFICVSLYAKEKRNIIINPSIKDFSFFTEISGKDKLYIGAIEELSPSSDSTLVGYTRKATDTLVPVICIPSPSKILSQALSGILSHNNRSAAEASVAERIISAKIKQFRIKEKTHRFLQTIDAEIEIDIELTNPYNASDKKKFTVSSQKSRTALDATKHAEYVLREALNGTLQEIFRSIN